MEKYIIEKLVKEQWSQEQIKGYCAANGIEMVSHDRIYQFIWEDKRHGAHCTTTCGPAIKCTANVTVQERPAGAL
jgi:IS30 family transposase